MSPWPPAGNLGGFADGNKPSFARQGNFGAKYQEWCRQWAAAILPLLHPGALVFCFGGPRTWHRLACGIEDAGFEMWDTISHCRSGEAGFQSGYLEWYTGQGFPKAQALDRLGAGEAWSGHKTCALKPSHEPILCFKAPMRNNNYAELATKYGSGCLNIDGGRVPIDPEADASQLRTMNRGQRTEDTGGQTWGMSKTAGDIPQVVHPEGRYPANLILECTCERTEVVAAPVYGDISNAGPRNNAVFGEDAKPRGDWQAYRGKAVVHTDPDCPCFMLDKQSGVSKSPTKVTRGSSRGMAFGMGEQEDVPCFGDTGGASRFFYNSKAIRREREAGLLGRAPCVKCGVLDSLIHLNLKTGKTEKCIRNDHPTVKPVQLCQYLSTLLLPPSSVPGRHILVPFSGSGSEILGCLLAGWDEVVGVEQDAHYCQIAEIRCQEAMAAGMTGRLNRGGDMRKTKCPCCGNPTDEVGTSCCQTPGCPCNVDEKEKKIGETAPRGQPVLGIE